MTRCCSPATGSSSSATAMRAAAPRSTASGSTPPAGCASRTPITSVERLLFVAQLCLAADRQPADLLHAALSRLGRRSARGAARAPQMASRRVTESAVPADRARAARSSSRRRMRDDPATARSTRAPHGHQLRPHRADARLLGDRRARAGLAHLLRLAPARSICGSPTPVTGGAARSERRPSSTACRFGRERPSAIGARGAPVDQFSFREDRADGMLNVLVRAEGGGDAMGGPEVTGGGVALLRLPIADFGDGSRERAGRALSLAARARAAMPGRSTTASSAIMSSTAAARIGEGDEAARICRRADRAAARSAELRADPCDRPDRGCSAATRSWSASGADAALGFTAVELPRRGAPRLGDVFTPARGVRRARRAATPSSSGRRRADGASGMLGLPVARAVEPAYRALLRQRGGDAVPAPRRAPLRRRPASSRRRCAASSTTIARRAASTGTAMPGRSSSATGSSPCSATSWSKAGWPARRIRETGRINFAPGAGAGSGTTTSGRQRSAAPAESGHQLGRVGERRPRPDRAAGMRADEDRQIQEDIDQGGRRRREQGAAPLPAPPQQIAGEQHQRDARDDAADRRGGLGEAPDNGKRLARIDEGRIDPDHAEADRDVRDHHAERRRGDEQEIAPLHHLPPR